MSAGRISTILGMLIGLALSASALYAVFFIDWSRPPEVPEQRIRPVRTILVGERPERSRTFPARVRATNEVTLSFEVPGTLRELPVTRGQRVAIGDVLAQLDLRDFESRLAGARVQLEQLETELAAVTRAFELEAATQIELARFRSSVDRARAERDIAQKSLEDATLRAPFEGVIADVFVDNFQKVSPGARVVRMQGSEPIRVEVNVDATRVALNRAFEAATRHAVRFDFIPGREYPARLAEFTTEADRATQTFVAIFEIEAPGDVYILPGMTGTLVERTSSNAGPGPAELSVPSEAVVFDGGGSPSVWLVVDESEDGTAAVRRFPITVGEVFEDSIVIKQGLSAGQRIVVAGLRELGELERVRPVAVEAGPR